MYAIYYSEEQPGGLSSHDRRVEWRIYYADGSTFDSSDGKPWDAPATRVLIINQRHHDPRERPFLVWQRDYYLWRFDRWYAVSYDALLFYWFIEKYPHPRAALAGETVDNPTWESIKKSARSDMDFFPDDLTR
jgi:hypothetical protein